MNHKHAAQPLIYNREHLYNLVSTTESTVSSCPVPNEWLILTDSL